MNKQVPRIVRSDLTKPSRWYVLTRYREKRGVNMDGDDVSYLVATTKYDVTEQMNEILAHCDGLTCDRERGHSGEHRGYNANIDEPMFWGVSPLRQEPDK